MRRLHIALLTVAVFIVLAGPATAQTYFPFGSVAVGIASTNVRVGPFGCYVSTGDPTYTTGQIHPCSLTTTGRLRVDTGALTVTVEPGATPLNVVATVEPGAASIATDATIIGTPTVNVGNLGPSSDVTYAATPCYFVSTASTNATNCKASAGNFYGVVRVINTTTTIAYLRLYNLATAPTCSSATGFIESIPIPPAAAAGGAGGVAAVELIPTQYSTGIAFCITGGGTSTDNTSAVAGVYGKLLYE